MVPILLSFLLTLRIVFADCDSPGGVAKGARAPSKPSCCPARTWLHLLGWLSQPTGIHPTLKGHAKNPTDLPILSKRSLGTAVRQQWCPTRCKLGRFPPLACRDGCSEEATLATEQRLRQQKLRGGKKGKFGLKSETSFRFLTYKRG